MADLGSNMVTFRYPAGTFLALAAAGFLDLAFLAVALFLALSLAIAFFSAGVCLDTCIVIAFERAITGG